MHVVFKHFQNFENFILNIALALWAFRIPHCKQPRLVKPWLNFDLNFIFKSSGTMLLETLTTSRHINNSFSLYLFPDSEFDNGGMKVQVKRPFFCHQKHKKSNRLCMKFSSTSNTSVQTYLYPLFQNQLPHFLLYHLFRRMSWLSGQDLQNGKLIYCRLPP